MIDPASPSAGAAGGGNQKDAAQTAIKAAKVGWQWTKKAAAFLWPRLKKSGKFVAEKVDNQMNKIVDSINQPKGSGQRSAVSGQPSAPKANGQEGEK